MPSSRDTKSSAKHLAVTTTTSSTNYGGKKGGSLFKLRGGNRRKEVLGDDDVKNIPKDVVPAAILPGVVAVGATQSSVKHVAATTS